MAFLVIDGITIPVSPTGGSTKTPTTIGSDSRAYAGNLRSTVRATKRSWQFTTKGLPEATALAIENAVNGGDFVDCSGDAFGGFTISCRVTTGDGSYQAIKGGHRRILVLTLVEV